MRTNKDVASLKDARSKRIRMENLDTLRSLKPVCVSLQEHGCLVAKFVEAYIDEVLAVKDPVGTVLRYALPHWECNLDAPDGIDGFKLESLFPLWPGYPMVVERFYQEYVPRSAQEKAIYFEQLSTHLKDTLATKSQLSRVLTCVASSGIATLLQLHNHIHDLTITNDGITVYLNEILGTKRYIRVTLSKIPFLITDENRC